MYSTSMSERILKVRLEKISIQAHANLDNHCANSYSASEIINWHFSTFRINWWQVASNRQCHGDVFWKCEDHTSMKPVFQWGCKLSVIKWHGQVQPVEELVVQITNWTICLKMNRLKKIHHGWNCQLAKLEGSCLQVEHRTFVFNCAWMRCSISGNIFNHRVW